MSQQLLESIAQPQLRADVPEFGPGDTVRVHVRVVEGNRERIQVFEGVVLSRRGGGISENFTVRRIASHGIGVERTFMLHSPRVEKIEVIRRGVVRRAQLYYLRGLTGKAARIKERRYVPGAKGKAGAVAAIAPVAALEEDVTLDTAADEEAFDDEATELEGVETSGADEVEAADEAADEAVDEAADEDTESETKA